MLSMLPSLEARPSSPDTRHCADRVTELRDSCLWQGYAREACLVFERRTARELCLEFSDFHSIYDRPRLSMPMD